MMMARPADSGAAPGVWYCVRAKVRREQLAAEHLRRIPDMEVFAPRIRYRRTTRRGPVWFEEALFPGYLFASFSWEQSGRLAQASPGVTGFVRFGGQIAFIEDSDIGKLRADMPANDIKVFEDPLKPGDRTVILEGPLRGLEVVIQSVLPASDRVRALFEFLGQTTELVIEGKLLERVPEPASGRKGSGQ